MTICDGCENIVTIVTTVTERRNIERKSQVQIPKDLLLALFQYHLAGNEEYLPEIEKALMEKLDSMVKRQLYTTFKTASTEEERKRQDKSIWISVECMRTFVGKDFA